MNVSGTNGNLAIFKARVTSVQAILGAEGKKGTTALNSEMIKSLKKLIESSRELGYELVSKPYVNLIESGQSICDTLIPQISGQLNTLSKKDLFLERDVERLDLLEDVAKKVGIVIENLSLLSTPEGQVTLLLKSMK